MINNRSNKLFLFGSIICIELRYQAHVRTMDTVYNRNDMFVCLSVRTSCGCCRLVYTYTDTYIAWMCEHVCWAVVCIQKRVWARRAWSLTPTITFDVKRASARRTVPYMILVLARATTLSNPISSLLKSFMSLRLYLIIKTRMVLNEMCKN